MVLVFVYKSVYYILTFSILNITVIIQGNKLGYKTVKI